MEKPSHNTKQTLIVLTLLLLHIGRDECKDTEPLSACVDMPNFSNVVLNKTDIFPVDIKLTLRAGVLTTYPTHASIQAVKMIEERYYCYDGTNIDPNTGCQHTVKVWELSAEELNQWKSKNGLCKVGVTCQFEGSCWGSTASACLLPQADQRTRWAKPDDLMGPLLPFLVFPHHTCTKGYRCSNHELKLPIQAGIVSEQGTHFPLVTLVDGKSKKLQVDVEDHFFEEGVNYLHGKITPKQEHVQASCFKTKFEVETCVILKDGVSRTVTLDKNCIGVTGNLVLALNCDFSGNKSSESAYYTNKGMIDTASSIGDLVKVSEQLLFYSAQNEFNIANLGAEVEKIKNSLIDLIRVLMVRDPHLIGVMTNSPIRSRANADGSSFSFQQCPHPNLPSGKLKACTQMFEMKDGVYVYRPISKPCPVEASNKTTTYLKLLDRSTLSFIELDRPEFNGANIDNPTIKTFKEDFAQAIKKSYSETIQQGESLPYNPYEALSRFYEGLKTAFSFIGGTYAILMLIKLLCAIRYSNKEI